jgi:hypothetical protein
LIQLFSDRPLAKTFHEIAKPYWVRKERSRVIEWRDTPVKDDPRWELRHLISTGLAFRSTRPTKDGTDGHDVYKGENIIATEIQGEAAIRGCDPAKAEAAYIWQYASVLPHYAYALAQMAHCPNAVRFDPTEIAFTNTATIFIPDERASEVPFDLLLMSDVYVWFYALAARMGVLRTCRSHIYPTNVAFLPWTEELISMAAAIDGLRGRLVKACVDAADASEALLRGLDDLGYPTLKERLRADLSSRIEFGENFETTGYEAEIFSPHIFNESAEGTQLRPFRGLARLG